MQNKKKFVDKEIKKFKYEKIINSEEYQKYLNSSKKKKNKKIRFADWDRLVSNGTIEL